MKFLLTLFLLSASGLVEAQEPAPTGRKNVGGKIQWRLDLDRALEEAKRSGRPILMYFTADW